MTYQRDYEDKTKSERRERRKEKDRERMDSGKRLKLMLQIIQRKSEEAKKRAVAAASMLVKKTKTK